MALKKFGKRITIDQLAAMVAQGFLRIEENMATKEDLKNYPTKNDLRNFATKDDVKNFATKDDIESIIDRKIDEKLAPIHKKLDNAIYHHEKRIDKIEERAVVLKNAITKDLKKQVNW